MPYTSKYGVNRILYNSHVSRLSGYNQSYYTIDVLTNLTLPFSFLLYHKSVSELEIRHYFRLLVTPSSLKMNSKCDRICENPPSTYTTASHTFHHQMIVKYIN